MHVRLTTINDAEGVFFVQKMTWLAVYPNKEYRVEYEDIAKNFPLRENVSLR